jgi:hypothetical protein
MNPTFGALEAMKPLTEPRGASMATNPVTDSSAYHQNTKRKVQRDEPVEIIISITRTPLTPARESARGKAMDAIVVKILRRAS